MPLRDGRAVLCCGLQKNGMVGAWDGHGMASVNQTRPHCVNQMGKTHSKPLAARHGRGMGTACYVCESALKGYNASVKDSYGARQYDVDKSKYFPPRQQGVFTVVLIST